MLIQDLLSLGTEAIVPDSETMRVGAGSDMEGGSMWARWSMWVRWVHVNMGWAATWKVWVMWAWVCGILTLYQRSWRKN